MKMEMKSMKSKKYWIQDSAVMGGATWSVGKVMAQKTTLGWHIRYWTIAKPLTDRKKTIQRNTHKFQQYVTCHGSFFPHWGFLMHPPAHTSLFQILYFFLNPPCRIPLCLFSKTWEGVTLVLQSHITHIY